MNYIQLENMNLSEIVLGTDGYGERINENNAYAIMSEYINNGGNVFDTARMYTNGESERIVGEFIRKNKIRDKVYISSKCAHPPINNMSKHRLTLKEIENDIDESLMTLNVDYIDIMWLHRDDVSVNVESVIEIMNLMILKGKIKYFGASNWYYDRISDANNYAEKSNLKGFVASQILYNMATCNKMWDDTLVVCENTEKLKYDKSKFPVFAFCSQAKGFFEKYHNDELSEKARQRYFNENSIRTYNEIFNYSKKINSTISYASLEFLKKQSLFPIFPVIGPSSVSQLYSTLNINK